MSKGINRRQFIAGASLVTLSAITGVGTNISFAKEPIKRVGGPKLKISLNAYSFAKLLNDYNKTGKGMSLFDLLDFCAKYNFDAVDATAYYFPGYPEKLPPDSFIYEFKRRAFELGLDISGTGVRNHFTVADKKIRAESVQHIKDWIEVAAKLGAPVIRVFADTQKRGLSWNSPEVAGNATREEVEEWIAENLHECAEHGKKYGVIVGVQNHGDFLKTADDLISLIKHVDSDWCGAIVDTGYFKTEDPYIDMAKAAPYAVNWQIKTSPFGQDSDIHIDLKRLIKIIKDSGYRGYLPIETLARRNGNIAYNPYEEVPKFLNELREAIEKY